MKVSRKYQCKSCGHVWRAVQRADDPFQDCPQCDTSHEPPIRDWSDGQAPAYKGLSSASKAVDTTYRIAEEQYGVTNMKDNMREGDVAYSTPQVSKEMQQVDMFNHQTNVGRAIAARGSAISMASGARAERQAMGIPAPFEQAVQAIKQDRLGPIGTTRRYPIARS